MNKIFRDEDPPLALEVHIDVNLRGNYPMEAVYGVSYCTHFVRVGLVNDWN